MVVISYENADNAKAIKKTSRMLLSGNWSRAFACLCFILFASLCFFLLWELLLQIFINVGMIGSDGEIRLMMDNLVGSLMLQGGSLIIIVTLGFLLFRFLLVSPLELGETMWYFSLATGSELHLGQMFSLYAGNDNFLSALLFKVGLAIRKLFFAVITLAPSAVAFGLAIAKTRSFAQSRVQAEESDALLLYALGAVLLIAGLILFVAILLRYFLAEYLFVQDPDSKASFHFSTSRRMMKGSTGRVVALFISFIPGLLLCLLIVPVMYVVPVMRASFAVLASDIMNEYAQGNK